MRYFGIILIIAGAAMLIWSGFSFTKKEKIIDAGPLEVSADKQERVTWPPYAGAILVVGGVVFVLMGRKKVY